jgi:hypothetical protein
MTAVFLGGLAAGILLSLGAVFAFVQWANSHVGPW